MLLQMAKFCSFFYGWVVFHCVCVCVCVSVSVSVFVYHIMFIHSSVDGHLGCFHILAIVTNAALNTGVYVESWIELDGLESTFWFKKFYFVIRM